MTNLARTILAPAAAVALLTLAGCNTSIDELVLNPNTKEEIITKLLDEEVAKQDIMKRLTTDDTNKRELAEILLGDTSIKTLAIDRLFTDRTQREALVAKIVGDTTFRGEVITALASGPDSRLEVQDALKKPIPKKN